MNVALYGATGKRWAMTERGRQSLQADATSLVIGPSALSWDGAVLSIDINEVTVPFPSRIRGKVRLHPAAVVNHTAVLDGTGRHRWRPIAPCARIEVDLYSPALRWAGAGYFDSNAGDEPLEDAVIRWNWSRSNLRDATAVLYDVARRDGAQTSLALRFDKAGNVSDFPAPPQAGLPRSGWRVSRQTRADCGEASVLRTVEDTPFYARSIVCSSLLGEPVTAMHESLDMDRFRSKLIQMMLPFRMPRRPR